MQFRPPQKPRAGENIVPMINVVFLLLIFFLMTAEIAPPDPYALTLPEAARGAAPDPDEPLFIGPAGELALGAVRGDAVFAALAARAPGPLILRADAGLEAAQLARLMPRIAATGVTELHLVTAPR